MATSLKECLRDWVDSDVAAYHLASTFGIVPPWTGSWDNDLKHIFWSANPLGDLAYEVLRKLAEQGVLEFDRYQMTYRWNPEWKLE